MKKKSTFSPLIKIFKEAGTIYAYDAASGLLCEIDENTADALTCPDDKAFLPVSLEEAQKRGVFKFQEMQRCTVESARIPESVKFDLDNNLPKRVILELTENCNLRCKYCFNTIGNRKRVHISRQMEDTTAFAAIDYYFKIYKEIFQSLSASEKEIRSINTPPTLSWWGGEPFLNFEVIKKSKEYFECLPWDELGIDKKTIRFSVVTNLTILTPEIMDFLIGNQIYLFVSIDGNQCLHDANRVFANGEGSFNIVKNNLDTLCAAAPGYCRNYIGLQAVYENNEMLAIAKKFFEGYLYDSQKKKKFYKIYYLFQSKPVNERDYYDKPRNHEKLLDTFKQRLTNLSLLSAAELKAKSENCEIDLDEFYELFKFENKIIFDANQGSDCYNKFFSCPIGAEVIYVAPDGNLHACHNTDESYPIGNIREEGINPNKVVRFYLDHLQNFQKDCKKCWAFRFCKKCPAQMLNNGHFVPASEKECSNIREVCEMKIMKYIIFLSNKELYTHIKKP